MQNIIQPSVNCWQVAQAEQASFIIDGEAYYRALHEAMATAQHSIIVVGWDLHSNVELIRDKSDAKTPSALGAYLDYLVRQTPQLNIYLLSWDFSMIYAMEREFFPRYKLRWRSHDRIHFCLDGEHPAGASQHQKIVVIDDAIAFSGGLDLSKWRWDTPDHLPEDTKRLDPEGKPYPPFHDVQLAVSGEAAASLGKLARYRWQRCSGEQLNPPATSMAKPGKWPASVPVHLRNIPVAVARTFPPHNQNKGKREVEQLFLDAIDNATHFLYIENQYLSSHAIAKALESRLKEPNGPEIVLVMPRKTGGWLEQHTMDVLRSRILQRLRKVDQSGRLQVYFPRICTTPDTELMVHAKVMIIDNRFVRVGSANLSNRSMGLDSECDLAIETEPGSQAGEQIQHLLHRLLAEHLDTTSNEVAEAITDHGDSLIAAIESLQGKERSLVPLDGSVPEDINQMVPESALIDPEKPLEPEELLNYFVSRSHRRKAYSSINKLMLLLISLLLAAAAWRWTPLNNWLDIDQLIDFIGRLNNYAMTPLFVPLFYMLGGITVFPVTLLILATIVIFGPMWGTAYSMLGVECSALLLFGAGRLLGKDVVSRLSGSLINTLNRKLSQSGLLAIIMLRILPVAPFSLINLVAGTSKIRLRDFALGTALGILPGILGMIIISDRVIASLRSPDPMTLLTLLLAIGMIIAIASALHKFLPTGSSADTS